MEVDDSAECTNSVSKPKRSWNVERRSKSKDHRKLVLSARRKKPGPKKRKKQQRNDVSLISNNSEQGEG